MNAASLQRSAGAQGTPPAVATAATPPQGAAAGGVTPLDGQGFVPASGTAGPAGAAAPGKAGDGSVPAEQALQALQQVLGEEYGAPIIAADGSVYMEKKKPSVKNGQLVLSYSLVGKIDRTTGRMKMNPAVLEQVKAKATQAPPKKLVKVDDQYVWQTFTKGQDGKVIAEVTPATEQELAAYQQQLQAKAAQQAQQEKLQNRGDWQQKLGIVAQNVGLFGSAGMMVSGLSQGPNPYSGRPGASWISGWILAQRLNGKAEGKLLPSWMQTGWVSTALEWGIQGYSMLDMGHDIRVLRDFFGKVPPPPAVNPGAVQQLVGQGHHPAMAQAMTQLGSELRTGSLQMVEGSANAAVLNTKAGALQLVPKDSLHKAFAATDPIQDGGLKLRGKIDGGVAKGLGVLRPLIQPAMMGATALGLISSAITVKTLADKHGKKVLLDTQQGRGALLGALSSAAFLGLYLTPMVLPGLGVAGATLGAAASAVNIASNVLGGIQMLNSYGLFGDQGFLNNDAVRAAFLIPPLTPIGAFAFYMKKRKQKAEAEAAKLQAAQKLAVERIQQQREMVKLQLQSAGQVTGTQAGADGSISVATSVPNDLTQLAAQLGGAPAAGAAAAPAGQAPEGGSPPAAAGPGGQSALEQQRQQLTMVARPMR